APARRAGALPAGVYTVTATDANGCTGVTTITVTSPAALATSGAVSGASCNGVTAGAIHLTVQGVTPPYAYAWTNDASTEDVGGLAAGGYGVTVTDAHACTTSASFTVTQPATLAAGGTGADGAGCGAPAGAIDVAVA